VVRAGWSRSVVQRPRMGGRGIGGLASTSQGHPRTIFRRAIEHNNLVLADVTAREIGRVTIAEALELTTLFARKPPERYGRFAARWLCLYLEGAREGDARACRVASLEPAIAREPEESRLGARDSEKALTSRLSLSAGTFGQGKVRTSGLPNEIRPCKETDDGEPKPGRRHPAIEASERNPLESQRCDRPRRCLSLPRSPAGGR
jgi:hypothetical protein